MLEHCQEFYKAATIYLVMQQSLKESKEACACKLLCGVGDQKMCDCFV